MYFLIILKLIVLLEIVDAFLFVPQKAENTRTVASSGYHLLNLGFKFQVLPLGFVQLLE